VKWPLHFVVYCSSHGRFTISDDTDDVRNNDPSLIHFSDIISSELVTSLFERLCPLWWQDVCDCRRGCATYPVTLILLMIRPAMRPPTTCDLRIRYRSKQAAVSMLNW